VDFLALGQLAHSCDYVERAVAVGVDEDDARALNGRSRDEHRERNIDDGIAAGPQSPRDLFGFRGGIADE
jgi:hypothetical protein